MSMTFDTALGERVDAMVDACTRCGKCVEACPITGRRRRDRRAGNPSSPGARPRPYRRRPEPSRNGRPHACSAASASRPATRTSIRVSCWRWRVAMGKAQRIAGTPPAGRWGLSQAQPDVSVLSRMQLTGRCSSGSGSATDTSHRLGSTEGPEQPDFVFYTGCNVSRRRTSHCLRSTLDGCARSDLSGHGWTVALLRRGPVPHRDLEVSGSLAENTFRKLASAKTARSCRGARAATCNSPSSRCRRTSGPPAASRSR